VDRSSIGPMPCGSRRESRRHLHRGRLYLLRAFASDFERRLTRNLLDRYRVEDRVIPGGTTQQEPVTPGEQLSLLYNACDVGLNTAMAEG
jgi:hypothetical protein